jgi:uncharacterized protein (DUF2147 family)
MPAAQARFRHASSQKHTSAEFHCLGFAIAMKRMHYVATSVAIATGIFPALAEPLPVAPAASSVSESPAAFAALSGHWVRPDGGYVISIKSIDAGGKVDASYANPNPLPFYAATATADSGTLKLFFELRAGGYNGSTYTLNYDAASDHLKGTYYQAVAKQTFEVVFVRK